MIKILFPSFFISSKSHLKQKFAEDFVAADRILLKMVYALSFIGIFFTGWASNYFIFSLISCLLVCGLTTLIYTAAKGELVCRIAIAVALTALLAINIQQMNGLGEGHFLFFITLTILIRYRDATPVITAGLLIVLHHLTLTYCQANDLSAFGKPMLLFSWGQNSSLGLLSPLLYHVIIAIVALVISLYFIFENNQRFLQDSALLDLAESAAAGDLSQRIGSHSNSASAQRIDEFMQNIDNLVTTSKSLAQTMQLQSDHFQSSSTSLRDKASEQQARTAFVATAIDQVASASLEIASNAEHTAKQAAETTKTSREGMQITNTCKDTLEQLSGEVDSASTTISDLENKSQHIHSIVDTISEIAEQTNLLALNAAIEAARAGEQGRGFAVVADEVRVLSKRTHDSTEEISTMIAQLKTTTEDAVKKMELCLSHASTSVKEFNIVSSYFNDISSSVNEISEYTSQIATAAEEQSHVTEDVSQNIGFINTATTEFVGEFETNQTGAAELKAQSQRLSELVGAYQ